MMNIVITGATGFIGRHLVRYFQAAGHHLSILTRQPRKAGKLFSPEVNIIPWDAFSSGDWETALADAGVMIHLAGASIARFWTSRYKRQIWQSRVQSTRILMQALQRVARQPVIFFQMSATGIYGSRGDETLTEQSAAGTGFLARVVREWETAGEVGRDKPIRRIIMRAGVVLGRDGGFLPRMERPMKWFLGGYPGKGRQWFSWIHVEEIPAIIQFMIRHSQCQGIYNFVAPEPVPLRHFCRTLANTVKRPCWLPIPVFPLKLLLPEMTRELILPSQRVLPQQLMQQGYTFRFPTLKAALHNLYALD